MARRSNPDRYILSDGVQELRSHEAIASPLPVRPLGIVLDVDSEIHSGRQTMHLGVAIPENPRGILLHPVSWSDSHTRSFHAQRLGAMARFGNVAVVGFDYPGMGGVSEGRGNELTERQLEQANNGRMTDIAHNNWRALAALELPGIPNHMRLPMALWCHSQASLMGAEMLATTPAEVKITDVDFSEIMGLKDEPWLRLAARFIMKGHRDLPMYGKMNDALPERDTSRDSNLGVQVCGQIQSHRAAVVALAGGMHHQAVREAYRQGAINLDDDTATRMHVTTAEHGLTPDRECVAFIDYLLRRTSSARADSPYPLYEVLRGEAHGYQDSLPALLQRMSRLAILDVA